MQILNFLLYFALTVLGMGVLIFVHELGHYLTARACHVTVHEFSLGMGKRLCGFTSKKTGIQYSLRLLPIGGYVAMAGEDEGGEGAGDPNAFCKKNVWQRMLILAAGAGMNVLTGFLAMLILTAGLTASGYRLPSTTIEYFAAGAPSYVTGLEKGDTVLRVGDTTVHTGYELAYEIMFSGYKPIDVLVERNGDRVLVENVRFPTEAAQGVAIGNMDFQTAPLEPTAWNVVRAGFWRGVSSIKMVFDSLKGIVTGRFGFSDLSGPIGVTSTVTEVAHQPMAGWNLLYLFAVIAMNLGVFNLLPIPALDGGRLFFRILEVLSFGKPISPKVEAKIHSVGMMLLLAFTAVIACKDIFNLF